MTGEEFKTIAEALSKNTSLKKLEWYIYVPEDDLWDEHSHFEVFPDLIATNSALEKIIFSVFHFTLRHEDLNIICCRILLCLFPFLVKQFKKTEH